MALAGEEGAGSGAIAPQVSMLKILDLIVLSNHFMIY